MIPRAARARVILRHCESYDVDRIRTLVREALEVLELTPRGRTLLKPNLVSAGPLFEHAYTRPQVVEGVLQALLEKGATRSELTVGERCGITIPTRYAMEHAGYLEMLERMGVRPTFFEEEQQVEIPLTHPGRLRDSVYVPEPVARADFFVNCPKFKAHPWTTVTFSMKNYIGLQDDRHRLIDHDHRLNEKVADLQSVLQPQLIVTDAIIAGEGRMMTPLPRPLKLLVLGNNQPAIDSVCCAIIGVDPHSVEHIRLASERGFGPIELSRIELSGDVSLEEAQRRAQGFKVGLVRVEKYFEGTRITAYAGPPPESAETDYCWGGCPGAIEEAIEILRVFDRDLGAKMESMPRLHVVFGAYKGAIDAKPGERVLFIGDCAQWKGQLQGEPVEIRSTYQPRETKDPNQAKHEDIYAKMVSVGARFVQARGRSFLRLHGCPVSVAEQILALVGSTDANNPFFDQHEVLSFNKAYLAWKASVAMRRLRGKKYQVSGPAERGAAKPDVDR
jgi:uncharacterized protein (DUF362 family)